MAYQYPLIKISFGGNVLTEDVWTNSFHYVPAGLENAREVFDKINPQSLQTAATAFYRGTSAGMASYNSLAWIKVALIGTDGKYVPDTEAKIYDYTTPINGNSAGAFSPQDSIVISLLTEAKRGLAYRGRFYPPSGFQQVQSNTGKLSTEQTGQLATRAVTFINAMNTALTASGETPGFISVASDVRNGSFNFVTGVEVGNLVDNQKRRRNKLSELYNYVPLTTTP